MIDESSTEPKSAWNYVTAEVARLGVLVLACFKNTWWSQSLAVLGILQYIPLY